MLPCHVVEITTPKKFILNGLWFGPKKPKKVIVWVHGLASSVFSKFGIIERLIDKETAVLAFNNRGHDNMAWIKNVSEARSVTAGAAAERFEDCVDDIDGALRFAKKAGARELYIAGHSTGCQKAVYWAYKKKRGVKGLILLAPMSDYAGMVKKYGVEKIKKLAALSRRMLRTGRKNEFVRAKFWKDEPNVPHRFLSLYTPDSVEQSIFSYFDNRPARILRSITLPVLVIFAERDEYADRPVKRIVEWFRVHANKKKYQDALIRNVKHSFKGGEMQVVGAIRGWIKAQ